MIFCVETLGCKVNQYETQAMESILQSRGHSRGKAGEGCDVCVINTCAVTGESARKSRQAVRRLKKLEPNALIAVCGCLSQLEPGAAREIGADLVGGSGDRAKFALELETLFREREQSVVTDNASQRREFEELPPGGAAGRTRAMLKIQDGCDNYCAYCIIPYARGHVRSLPRAAALRQARQLTDEGYREIVVTGIEISSYGRDLSDGTTPGGIIRAIGEAAPGVRLRIGSLDPSAITEELCGQLNLTEGLCDHFHLSLQSGCDETLMRMKRKYDTEAVREALARLRRYFPNCGITADLITGFPGETEEEFNKTLAFIKESAFSAMHIFPYSERPGTPAASMAGQVEKAARRERARTAAQAAAESAERFRELQVGRSAEVLLERERGGFWTGYARNYVEVSVVGQGSRNSVQTVQITGVKGGVVWGENLRPQFDII